MATNNPLPYICITPDQSQGRRQIPANGATYVYHSTNEQGNHCYQLIVGSSRKRKKKKACPRFCIIADGDQMPTLPCNENRQLLEYYVQGLAYSNQMTITGGGAVPFTFTYSGVGLPSAIGDGFTFSPTGLIGGTPTRTGTYLITVTATDANGCTSVQDFTLAPSPI